MSNNDFFSSVSNNGNNSNTHQDNVRTFADAISDRFAASTNFAAPPLLTARLLSTDHHHHPSMPLPSSATTSSPSTSGAATTMVPSPFIPVSAALLSQWLSDPTALVVDIRPPQAYATARIPRALSLSVPSTLLKRPNFSLDRLAAMLPSATARSRFNKWHTASRILVYDADSSSIPDHSNIQGLLRKFRNDPVQFKGDLAWLVGGFQALWRDQPQFIDNGPPSPAAETEDDDASVRPVLRARDLPKAAFSFSSTTGQRSSLSARLHAQGIPALSLGSAASHAPPVLASHSRTSSGNLPIEPPPSLDSTAISTPSNMSLSFPSTQTAYNPFFETIRQNTELSHGITERIPLRLPRRVRRRIHDLPFRWLQEIARKAEAVTPPGLAATPESRSIRFKGASSSDSESDPPPQRFANVLDPATIDEGTEALAMQFYRIELAEQRRLMGVMDHHSKESESVAGEHVRHRRALSKSKARRHSLTHRDESVSPRPSPPEESAGQDVPFPFSITAGVEKGAKNRYRYIWPFEHARVRLHQRYRRKRSISSPPHPGTPAVNKCALSPPSSISGHAEPSGSTDQNIVAPRPTYPTSVAPPPSIRSPRPPSQLATFASSLRPLPSSVTQPLTTSQGIVYGAGGVIPPINTHGLTPSPFPLVSPVSSEPDSEYDDYVNASYVQPLGTTKKYIATQGPMPATFTDFWTLVWEQNVHVIVMLTRQSEGGMIKCGSYWTHERFGHLRLKLIEESSSEIVEKDVSTTSNPFEAALSVAATAQPSNPRLSQKQPVICRVFELRHTKYPIAGVRRIVQLQFVDWPDMNVPDDPRAVLDLIWQVDQVVKETNEDRRKREQEIELRKMQEKERDRGIRDVAGRGRAVNPRDAASNLSSDQRSTMTASSSSEEDVDELTGIVKHACSDEEIPVLVHCSAGVGRTGGFLAIDAVLDGVRRELKKRTYDGLSGRNGLSSGDASGSVLGSGSGSVSGSAAGIPGGLASRGGSVGESIAERSLGPMGSRGSGSGSGSGNVADRSVGDEDKMDVDESSPGEIGEVVGDEDVVGGKMGGTVPLAMTAGDEATLNAEERLRKGKRVRNIGKGKEIEGRGGLVVHVPFVVGDRDLLKTPIQMAMEIDDDEAPSLREAGGEEQKASTRKWAETVLDETSAAMVTGEPMVLDERSAGSSKSHSASPPAAMSASSGAPNTPASTELSGEGSGGRSGSLGASGSSGSSEASFEFGRRHRQHPSHAHLYESTGGSGTSTSLATSVSAGSRNNGTSSPSAGVTKDKGNDDQETPFSRKHVEESVPNPALNIDTGTTVTTTLVMDQASISPSVSTPLPPIGSINHASKQANNAAGVGPSPLGPAVVINEDKGKTGKYRGPVGGRFRSGVNLDVPRVAPSGTGVDSRSASTTSLSPAFGNIHPSLPLSVRNVGISFPGNPPPSIVSFRDARGTSVFSSEDEPPPSRSISLSPSVSGASETHFESVGSKLGALFRPSKSDAIQNILGDEKNSGKTKDRNLEAIAGKQQHQAAPKATDSSQLDSRPGSTSPPGSRSRSTPPSLSSNTGKKPTMVDYKEPRPLHASMSPPPLSSYEDPICELVQDMREQRMSLCQSLRQYVFVHAAIIEGVLRIVDEERDLSQARVSSGRNTNGSGSGNGSPKSKESRSVGSGSGSRSDSGSGESGSGSTSANEESGGGMDIELGPSTPIRSALAGLPPSMTMPPSTGKRGASPTELLKEDKKGVISLSKRPSLKRKQTSSDGSGSNSSHDKA